MRQVPDAMPPAQCSAKVLGASSDRIRQPLWDTVQNNRPGLFRNVTTVKGIKKMLGKAPVLDKETEETTVNAT